MSGFTQMKDNDSLHILPLSMIPLQMKALQRTRLIKNTRLEGNVELYREGNIGSGQIAVSNLEKSFDFAGDRAKDLFVVKKLAALPSYDVYSLRVSLRKLRIQIDNVDSLRLSDDMAGSLTDHMLVFTRPLIQKIYGGSDIGTGSFDDLLKLFTDPNADAARQNLRDLATALEIGLMQIPQFLEDYADVFLSLSFYTKCHDDTVELLEEFLDDINQLAHNPNLNGHAAAARDIELIGCRMRELHAEIANVLEMFRVRTADMWDHITAERYRRMSRMVIAHQETIGAILCAIMVKLNAWEEKGAVASSAGISERISFITREIGYGLDRLTGLEFQDI